jgi:hypothetical protein
VVTRRLAGRAAAALALGVGLAGIGLASLSLRPEYVYRKDFICEYLLARALQAGVNPYLGLNDLAAVLRVELPAPIFAHPTPHPPGLALFSWPLAWLTYQQAAVSWFGLELICLALGIAVLIRWYDPAARWTTIAWVGVGAAGSQVVWRDLLLGQSGTLLFALLVLSWAGLRGNREVLGGTALGLAIALKLTAWPVTVALLAARRWVAAAAAVVVVAAVNVLAVLAMGWQVVADYYLRVAPYVGSLYRASFLNLSLTSVGWRVFDATGSPYGISYLAPPVVALPWLAPIAGGAVALAVLAGAAWQVSRLRDFDARFGVMAATSLLLSPLVWDHYLLVAAIPGAIVAANLRALGYPRGLTACGILAALLVAWPGIWSDVVPEWFARSNGHGGQVVPTAVSLLALVPTLAVLVGLGLCAATSRAVARQLPSRSTVDSPRAVTLDHRP